MMLERFTGDARGVVTGARESALRLGHDWIGCEHLLLALTATGGEVGMILRDQGITPDRVRREAVRLAGAGGGASRRLGGQIGGGHGERRLSGAAQLHPVTPVRYDAVPAGGGRGGGQRDRVHIPIGQRRSVQPADQQRHHCHREQHPRSLHSSRLPVAS